MAKELHEYYKNRNIIITNEMRDCVNDDSFINNELEIYLSELEKDHQATDHAYFQIVSYIGNNKAKQNSTKIKSKFLKNKVDKIIKNVNFKTHDNDFKVQSIPITRIIGTQLLITFNVKNRKLSLYYAKDETGLQIKGTTIINFDTNKSLQKTLRDPAHYLSHLQQSNDRRAKIVFRDLTTKSVSTNGRLNKHTILLKAFKKLTIFKK